MRAKWLISIVSSWFLGLLLGLIGRSFLDIEVCVKSVGETLDLPTKVLRTAQKQISHNSLTEWFEGHHSGRVIFKWTNYFAVYHKLFHKYVGKKVVVLEIGVQSGGSIDMWREYFGEGLTYHGLDLSPWPKKHFEDKKHNIFIHTGSQEDRSFLRKLALELGQVDILIDDGGHTMRQQITTLEVLFDLVAPDGIFLTEDVHTSYADGWDGAGYRKKGNFVEYVKKIIDQLYGFYHHQTDPLLSDSLNNVWKIASISFYPGIIAFEKQPILKPESQTMGSQKLKFDSGRFICPSQAQKKGTLLNPNPISEVYIFTCANFHARSARAIYSSTW